MLKKIYCYYVNVLISKWNMLFELRNFFADICENKIKNNFKFQMSINSSTLVKMLSCTENVQKMLV